MFGSDTYELRPGIMILSKQLASFHKHRVVEQAAPVGDYMRKGLYDRPGDCPIVGEIHAAADSLGAGVVVRAMGGAFALCPPPVTIESDIDRILDIMQTESGPLRQRQASRADPRNKQQKPQKATQPLTWRL